MLRRLFALMASAAQPALLLIGSPGPGDIVVMTNPAAHPVSLADITPWEPAQGRMVAGIRAALEAKGAELR